MIVGHDLYGGIMTRFNEYGLKYPYLGWDIWQFFADYEIKSILIKDLEQKGFNPSYAPKCILDFCSSFKDKYYEIDTQGVPIQPRTVVKVCEKLCENGILRKVTPSGFNNFDNTGNFYDSGLRGTKDEISKNKELFSRSWNNLIYGFPYIYESNKDNVRPIWVIKDGHVYNGTCFNSSYGIITAKHCIDRCDKIQIDQISSEVLKSAKLFECDGVDLVCIMPSNDIWRSKFVISDGNVLDDIMVMGYPNHCGFDRFLTATTGSIAAIEQSYLTPNYKLMLLTGKIKGGNSGGPVINTIGQVVGIITESAAPEGDYDNFGYGMAIPSSYLNQLNESKNCYNWVDDIS